MPFISKINGVDFSASYAATSSYVNLGTDSTIGPQFLKLDNNNYPVLRGYRLYISGGTSTTITGNSVYVGVDGGITQLIGTVSLPIATYDITASQALTASLATTASLASTASFLTAGTYQITSSRAINALTSSYFRGPGTATISDDGSNNLSIVANRVFITGSNSVLIRGNNGIDLNNNTTVYGNLLPGGPYTDNTSSYNLGSSTAAWKDLYVSNGSINFISGSNRANISFINGQITFLGSTANISGSLTGSLLGTASWATNATTATNATNATTATNTSYVFVSENQPNNYPWSIPVLEGSGGSNSLLCAVGPTKASSVANWSFPGGIESSGLFPLAGTNTIPPLKLTTGTNLTSPEAGAIEYDGVTLYRTNDTTSGRGYEPSTQIFRLTANGSAIGPTIANFFGANSAIQLAAGGVYEIRAYCAFTKATTGTVTVTITTSAAPQSLSGTIQNGASAGNTATGAAQQISIFNSTSAAAAFGASTTLNNGTNHLFCIKLLVEANASASNLRFNFTNNVGGTVTPLRGSYYKVTKLPSGNVGNFVA